jgi:SMC interacting uncharacterized protein involved in chromosome segregation
MDWLFKLLEGFEMGKSEAVLSGLLIIGSWVWFRREINKHLKVEEGQDVQLCKHGEALATLKNDLIDAKVDLTSKLSRVEGDMRELKMSNSAELRLLAYKIDTVDGKIEDVQSRLTASSERQEEFIQYVYEHLPK